MNYESDLLEDIYIKIKNLKKLLMHNAVDRLKKIFIGEMYKHEYIKSIFIDTNYGKKI